jgi:heme-degrading monooxygenase HmoA
MVTFLVLARMSFWTFKKGKREEAFVELDKILNTSVQTAEGFRGYLSLLSYENADELTVLTIWQDEESMNNSEKGVFNQAIQKVQEMLENPPCTEKYRVYSTQLLHPP